METTGTFRFAVCIWMQQTYGHRILNGILDCISRRRTDTVTLFDASELTPTTWNDLPPIDGLIAVLDRNEIWRFENAPFRTVLVPRFSAKHHIPSVSTDSKLVGTMVAEHFLSRGLKHMTMAVWQNDVQKTFNTTIQNAGGHLVSPPPSLPNKQTTNRQLNAWIRNLPVPCGVAVQSDHAATRLIRAITEFGLRVPEDIAVMGLHDEPLISMRFRPTLTSVSLSTERLGWAAAELLADLCLGKNVSSAVTMPPAGIIERESTACIYPQEDMTGLAVQHIQAYASKPLNTTTVARLLGVSRFTLHRRFRKQTGRSVSEEIRRQRLQRATHMLAHTDATVKEVSHAVGLPIPSVFSRFIKHHTGLSPQQYRNKHRPRKH